MGEIVDLCDYKIKKIYRSCPNESDKNKYIRLMCLEKNLTDKDRKWLKEQQDKWSEDWNLFINW